MQGKEVAEILSDVSQTNEREPEKVAGKTKLKYFSVLLFFF